MNRNFHIFITPKYYDKCFEYGLFGVSETGKKWGINQLANVRKDDIVFFFTTEKIGKRSKGLIYGPFELTSGLFYNNKVVWINRNGKDVYSYRVKFRSIPNHYCKNPLPIQRLFDIRDENKIKSIIDTSSFKERSVSNIFQEEGQLILEALLQQNPRAADCNLIYKGHQQKENPVELFTEDKIKKEGNYYLFKRESYLETYLLLHKDVLLNLMDFNTHNKQVYQEVFNQVGTYIAGGNIDILILLKEKLFSLQFTIGASAIELKNETLEADNINQLKEYMEWSYRILPQCRKEMIKGILVGPKKQKKSKKRNTFLNDLVQTKKAFKIKVYEYHLDVNSQKVLLNEVKI